MKHAADGHLPFAQACEPRPLGDGTFTTTLRSEWSIAGNPHSGFLAALMARTAVSVLDGHEELAGDPLSVSVVFLRLTGLGPALLRTDVRKSGRQTTVVSVRLEQRGRSCVEATVIVGRLPRQRPVWADLPVLSAEPPVNAVALGENLGSGVFRLMADCDVRLDASTAPFVVSGRRIRFPNGSGERTPSLRLRGWVRPRNADADVYFALLAGDIAPPVTFGLGRTTWSPTVQLTGLVRTHPAPGWLRVQVDCRAVQGHWFDSDTTVLDSDGQLVCQARRLASTPGP